MCQTSFLPVFWYLFFVFWDKMQKPAKYDWKDSNMALFGSDTEKQVCVLQFCERDASLVVRIIYTYARHKLYDDGWYLLLHLFYILDQVYVEWCSMWLLCCILLRKVLFCKQVNRNTTFSLHHYCLINLCTYFIDMDNNIQVWIQ